MYCIINQYNTCLNLEQIITSFSSPQVMPSNCVRHPEQTHPRRVHNEKTELFRGAKCQPVYIPLIGFGWQQCSIVERNYHPATDNMCEDKVSLSEHCDIMSGFALISPLQGCRRKSFCICLSHVWANKTTLKICWWRLVACWALCNKDNLKYVSTTPLYYFTLLHLFVFYLCKL